MGRLSLHILRLSLLFALTLPTARAEATTFFEKPFPESVKDAPVIVHGKIGNTFTDWSRGEEGGKRIYTFWDVQVTETLKGVTGDSGTIRMREMGGEKDGTGMMVSGAASFRPGEDVVVFLSEKNAEGSFDVWGMMMGKYNVQKDENGQEVLSGPGINDLTESRIGDAHEGQNGQDGHRGSKKWNLDSVRRLVASQGDAPGAPSRPAAKPSVTPVAPESASPTPAVTEVTPTPAPQLQNSSPEEAPSSSAIPIWGWVAGALGLVLAFVLLRRK
jgi:MYXO-CTERM domain-containing protein